jgi:PKD repeat protein
MPGLSSDKRSTPKAAKATYVLAILSMAGIGALLASRLHAAYSIYPYPPDKNVIVTRSFEPNNFSTVSNGGSITVTVDVANNEDVALRGFYYSDQVPSGWVVNTANVSLGGSPIADYAYEQGCAAQIYTDLTPHRWALELPQDGGVFSPTHAIPAPGGTAQIVYTMIVSGGSGSDYTIGYDAWAGWLQTVPTGTAVFGYQDITSTLHADFSASPRFGLPPLSVQFTDLSIGDPTGWTWAFGDHSPFSSQQHPTHTYTLPGIYTVTLNVTNLGRGHQIAKPAYITITSPPPTADFVVSSRSGVTPFNAVFTDCSTGDITAWLWDFGDGLTSTVQRPAHTYVLPGQFGVTLTVSGPGGSDAESKPDFVFVGANSAPPVADFTASPRIGTAPLTVTFTNLSAGDVTTWTWSFGDEAVTQTPSPVHVYNQDGPYTVALTAGNATDHHTLVRPHYITVATQSLQANFTAQPRFGLSPLAVQFTDLSTREVLTHVWDFGDGITASLPNPTRTYTALGYYTVSLTVWNSYGGDVLTRPRCIHVTDVIHNVFLPVTLRNHHRMPER